MSQVTSYHQSVIVFVSRVMYLSSRNTTLIRALETVRSVCRIRTSSEHKCHVAICWSHKLLHVSQLENCSHREVSSILDALIFQIKSDLSSLRYRKPNKMTQPNFPASTSQFLYFFFSNNVEKTAKTNPSFPLSPKFAPIAFEGEVSSVFCFRLICFGRKKCSFNSSFTCNV